MSENVIQQYFIERVILAARNNDVDSINNALLQNLPGESKTSASANNYSNNGIVNNAIPNEYLNTMSAPGMPIYETTLKVCCPIMKSQLSQRPL
jgi:hypothetical protein